MTDYAAVLAAKYADKQWVINGDDYEGLEWLDDAPKPTKKQLDDLWPEIYNKALESIEARAAAAASARAKLAALGLSEAEVAAIIGG
jgi:hypothetical protein